MARGRARWKRVLDIKPYLGHFFGCLETHVPMMARSIRYCSLTETPKQSEFYEDFSRPTLMGQKKYSHALDALSMKNVDGLHTDTTASDIVITSATLEACTLYGHTLFPINDETGRIVSHVDGKIPWGVTYPSISLKTPIKIPGTITAIPKVNNYYHLMVDYLLPVLASVIRNPDGFNGPLTFVLNHDYPMLSLLIEAMRELGVDARIMKVSPSDTVRGDQYLWAKSKSASTEHGYAFKEEIRVLSKVLSRQTGHIKVPEKVFIPRSKTRLRNLTNQDELIRQLGAQGFVPRELDWSRPLEQIAIFQRAQHIISVHGAALTNIIWGEGRGRILEIFPDNARKTTFLHIASQNDWAYDYVLGSPEAERQNFSVSIDDVLAKIA